MPVLLPKRGGKTKREIDIQALKRLLAQQPIDHAFIEKVGAMPERPFRWADLTAQSAPLLSQLQGHVAIGHRCCHFTGMSAPPSPAFKVTVR